MNKSIRDRILEAESSGDATEIYRKALREYKFASPNTKGKWKSALLKKGGEVSP